MKKKHILTVVGVALCLGACDYNDKNFDGLDEMVRPTNVLKEKYTLVEADYATISDNNTNKKIAEEAGVSKALENVKTNMFLSEEIPGATYLPSFIASRYFTADEGSSVKIVFNYKDAVSDLQAPYYGMEYLKLSKDDYKIVHGKGYYGNYLNASTTSKLYKIFNEKYPNAENGSTVFAEYNYNETAKPQKMEDPVYTFDFESLTENTDVTSGFSGWFVVSKGEKVWQAKFFDDNKYIQFSANGAKGAEEAWLVSPVVKIETGDLKLAFDVNVGYYNADCLSVLISEDFDGKDVTTANWVDVTADFTIPKEPAKGYGQFASAGTFALAGYAGKNIYVAFKYMGDGDKANLKTTTYQIDNVVVGKDIPVLVSTEPHYAAWYYNGKGWNTVNDKNVLVLTPEDYTAMGEPGKNMNFSSTILSDDYLPAYLSRMVAFPVNGDAKVVIYRYYNGKQTNVRSDEYIYSSEAARWVLNDRIIEKTEQYVLSKGKWNFDPSTVITLPAVKGNVESEAFYQAIVDYVGKQYGTDYYQTKYTNAEFYFGASSYQNNFSFSVYSWRNSNIAGLTAYKDMTDEELTNLMFERLPEAIQIALVALYADADAVPGVEVTYTVNFSIYDGKETKQYTIKFLVTGKAVFEYVEDSLKEVTA